MRRLRFLLPLLFPLLPSLLGAEGFTGWQRTSTEHFVFIYEKRDRAVVAELRSFAEEVYTEVTSFFGSYPNKIWVVVDGRTDAANGYYVGGFLPSQIGLNITSPSVPFQGSKEHQYLRLLFIHELTHYVHLDYEHGFFAVLSKVFGPSLKPGDESFLPDWMMEGIAVNTETMFTEGGRGRNPFFEMEYRALILENHFFSLKKAAYASAFPPYDRVYVGGYLFVHYLLQRFGTDTFAKIQRRFARFPLFGPWAAIRKVTGMSADRLYGDMVRELRRKYAHYSSIPPGRLISPNRVGDYELPVVTDRGWYEYRSNLDSAPAVVRIDPKTRKEQVLVNTSLTDYTSLTADRSGNEIVFASFDVTLGRTGTVATSDLFSLDPLTRRVRRITNGKHLWQPALSPSGKTLVAVQRRENFSRLVLVDQRTGVVTPLFEQHETNVFNPAFSPDGRLLTFALNDHGRQRVMVLDLRTAVGRLGVSTTSTSTDSGGVNRNLSLARPLPGAPNANAYFPRFAGANHVIFVADIDGSLALYEQPLTGGKLYRMADDPVGVSSGLIEDGRIIYTSYSENGTVLREKRIHRVAVPSNERNTSTKAALPPPVGGRTAARSPMPPRGTESVVRARRYVDWPRPLFWVPLPFYDYLPANARGPSFGFGAMLYGASVLGRNTFTLGLSFRTDVLQPSLNLDLSSMIGTSTLNYTLSAGYAAVVTPAFEQSVTQSLSVTIPLVAENITGATTILSARPGVSDALSIRSNQPFSVLAPFQNPSAFVFTNRYALDLGLGYSRTPDAPLRAIYPPRDTELSLQGSYIPSQGGASGLVSIFTGTLSVPSFFRNQAVRFGLKASYSTLPFSGSIATTIRPRGLFLSLGASGDPVYEQSMPGRTIVSADYLFNLALLDTPLPLGLNLQGIAMGLHVAAAADWNPRNAAIAPDHSLYAGAEVVALFGYQAGGSPLPIGFGISVRFDPTLTRPFDAIHDIGPYLFFGTNSFASTLLSSAAATTAAQTKMPPFARVDF